MIFSTDRLRLVLLAIVSLTTASVLRAALPALKVSDNRGFLVTADGKPFFYLGDTAWELFHRLNREEADRYLEDRAKKGFNVIQAVALAEEDGLNTPNPYGHRPLVENDPARPDVKDGAQNDYWDHVDYIVQKAESLGLYLGLLPTWGDKWNLKWGVGPVVFTPANAATYGKWIGRRYKDHSSVFWILGGDRPVENDTHRAIINAMAAGVRRGDGGAHLITFHPWAKHGSSEWFHDADWLDFNMRQNGHPAEYPYYARTRADYDRRPIKPVIDGEPIYEDHPIFHKGSEYGYSTATDVRRPLYWDLFAGAFGHTYGHHSVWQMWQPGRKPVNGPLLPWHEAINASGAEQMQHGRRLIESRPFLTRIPDDTVIVESAVSLDAIPGAGRHRFAATRDESGSYAMVYVPLGRPFKVRMNKIAGAKVKAWWFDPRTGKAQAIGEFPNTGEREFLSPNRGESIDWVLVLDDAAKNFPAPGTRQ